MADHYELAKKLKRMSSGYVMTGAADPDWSVVMLFYSALHVTTAYMINVGDSGQYA